MKKILIFALIAVPIVFSSCKKDKERTEQTFYVEIYRMENDSVEVAPEYAGVWLLDGNLEVDWDSSAVSYKNKGKMMLTNGNEIAPLDMSSDEDTHKHTLESIKNGTYWIGVNCPIKRGTIEDGEYPRGYRKITVNKDIHNTTLKFVFTDEDRVHQLYYPFVEK